MCLLFKRFIFIVFISTVLLLPTQQVQAEIIQRPASQVTPFDLVNAVNALRAAYGLAPYSINSILMLTAQNQADFMAATGNVTHSGPNGIGLTDRLVAAGYPLAGDLSLGGFRAENISSGNENTFAGDVIDGWMSDAVHQNTMLSPNLSEIGAGVAISNGRVYFVIDCALPKDASIISSEGTPVFESGTNVPADEALMFSVALSTPNAQGQVIHEVQAGQTLWQIAISYNVKIDDIKRLNNLFDNNIYPGNTLLIKLESTPTLVSPTATMMPSSTVIATPTLAVIATPSPVILKATPAIIQAQVGRDKTVWVIAIIVLALIGAGIFALLGSGNDPAKDR